jgi:hypothetical protein
MLRFTVDATICIFRGWFIVVVRWFSWWSVRGSNLFLLGGVVTLAESLGYIPFQTGISEMSSGFTGQPVCLLFTLCSQIPLVDWLVQCLHDLIIFKFLFVNC